MFDVSSKPPSTKGLNFRRATARHRLRQFDLLAVCIPYALVALLAYIHVNTCQVDHQNGGYIGLTPAIVAPIVGVLISIASVGLRHVRRLGVIISALSVSYYLTISYPDIFRNILASLWIFGGALIIGLICFALFNDLRRLFVVKIEELEHIEDDSPECIKVVEAAEACDECAEYVNALSKLGRLPTYAEVMSLNEHADSLASRLMQKEKERLQKVACRKMKSGALEAEKV